MYHGRAVLTHSPRRGSGGFVSKIMAIVLAMRSLPTFSATLFVSESEARVSVLHPNSSWSW